MTLTKHECFKTAIHFYLFSVMFSHKARSIRFDRNKQIIYDLHISAFWLDIFCRAQKLNVLKKFAENQLINSSQSRCLSWKKSVQSSWQASDYTVPQIITFRCEDSAVINMKQRKCTKHSAQTWQCIVIMSKEQETKAGLNILPTELNLQHTVYVCNIVKHCMKMFSNV